MSNICVLALECWVEKEDFEKKTSSFLFRGQVINMRYLEYFEKILQFIKDRILVYHG